MGMGVVVFYEKFPLAFAMDLEWNEIKWHGFT